MLIARTDIHYEIHEVASFLYSLDYKVEETSDNILMTKLKTEEMFWLSR